MDERAQIALLDPQLQNSYTYARNNPVRFEDPSGEFIFPMLLPYLLSFIHNNPSLEQLGVSMTPYVGDGIDAHEASTGTNFFSGEQLTSNERYLTGGAALIPFVSGKILRGVDSAFRSYKDVILGAVDWRKLEKGPRRGFIRNQNIDEVFNTITEGAKKLGDNLFRTQDGTYLKKYDSTSENIPTIHINQGGDEYKIRFTDE